ncbi:alpha-amylase family glycosyl hydrolase [Geomonas sp.]|uniref:alpha-amylase family glycosyl hydrolase n=1 Tax=Geomonas sp. TaxID=2651584 RepID=UPI002B48120F|nr:alpha-amylase family glycosyl hydrolase [Geomonas sp.]HJV36364.1 alpha-amylase family glycosyl hydrolase [Geomonas sp.]
MKKRFTNSDYFPFHIQISAEIGRRIDLRGMLEELGSVPGIIYSRRIAARVNRQLAPAEPRLQPGLLHLYGILNRVFRYVIGQYCTAQQPQVLVRLMEQAGYPSFSGLAAEELARFMELFPSKKMVLGQETPDSHLSADDPQLNRRSSLAAELLLLLLAGENRALNEFRQLFDDAQLKEASPYPAATGELDRRLATAPPFQPVGVPLSELLRAPMKASPDSLTGQIAYIREHWAAFLPSELLADLVTALDIVSQEGRSFFQGRVEDVNSQVLKFGRYGKGGEYPEYERFSPDADWMPNVVMIAKMVYVWLGQLSKQYNLEVRTLDQIPDAELDKLSRWGFTALWLIGIWERSPSSQQIKHISGNTDAISSAYSLYDYVIAQDLGGDWALENLKKRCAARGIRLASDMVPNHTGLYSKWTLEHPDWFIQVDYPPYPDYQFNGPDLSPDGRVGLFIEDGYWDKRDAAVVFKHLDRGSGRARYIYHGNDGTSTPWNDTAQLNYLLPAVREAVIQTILHVARQTPIIRFDAAMTLAKKHYQRLWFPLPGHGSGVPSRAEHGMEQPSFDAAFPTEFWREVVDRVAAEAPDTLLLAEAFWLMEGYFVRTLGMHRVYNSAFMNMVKMEENAKYRQTLKNVLEFEPEILKRFVNFMNNPDERTAVEQFGKEGKYFGATVLLVTMPGLPMIGHGQIEGFHEKYGMEYKRAYWDEPIDYGFVHHHETHIFPLMRRRHIFSGADQFVLYDFFSGDQVDENVFAYSNRAGNDRGLIIYNNRYGDTAGWIRYSCATLRKDVAGKGSLVQRSLGEALDFNGDGRHYYSFKDYGNGLSYLRSGRDLWEQGLYVEMSGYEYHAFLDFKEIRDDEFGTWGTLCYRLNGAGVESIEEEVKQVRWGAANEALRSLLAKVAAGTGEPGADAASLLAPLEPLLASFYKALAPQAKEKELRAQLASFGNEMTLAIKHSPVTPADHPQEWLLLCTFLALHRIGALTEISSAEAVDYYGLLRPVEQTFSELPASEEQEAPLSPREWANLLMVLIKHETFLDDCRDQQAAETCRLLFEDPLAGALMCLHESDGVEWFNKERFELILDWFARLYPYGAAPQEEPDAAVCALLCEAGGASGYRLDRLLALLENGKPL